MILRHLTTIFTALIGQQHRRRVPCAVRLTEEDDGTVAMLNEKSVIILNSAVICYFCVELNRAPKIMKFFVWPLWDVNYLGKILNVTFQYILNVIKIAQIN